MTLFWTLAGGLAALSLFFAVWPLLRRPVPAAGLPDRDAINLELVRQRLAELDADLAAGTLDRSCYESARHDLERELLQNLDDGAPAPALTVGGGAFSRWVLALLLTGAVPAGAVLLYLQFGQPELIGQLAAQTPARSQPVTGPNGETLPPMEVLVQRLAERQAANPANIDGWLMLGRSYFALEQPGPGLDAFRQAHERAPERSDAALAYAEGLAATSPGGSLDGEPARLIRQVLDREPDQPTALWLDGMLAYQQSRFETAVATWRRILDTLDPEGEEAANVREMIAEAETRSQGQTPESEPAPAAEGAPPPADGAATP